MKRPQKKNLILLLQQLQITKKMKRLLLLMAVVGCINHVQAQSFTSRSNAMSVDYGDPKKVVNSTLPKITWQAPVNETVFSKDGKISIELSVESKTPLKSIQLILTDNLSGEKKGAITVPLDENKLSKKVTRDITMTDGVNGLEVVVENRDGVKSSSKREFHVGATALADASKLARRDYALIFATDKYDNWKGLVNPIFDARTIANEIQKTYGFVTEVVENPNQSQVLDKLREYAEKKYGELDQLFIFFAGHGFYDETFKEGFVVTRESLPDDPGRNSYLRHSVLRSTINNNPCQHIFLVMDVCFGGTFDDTIGTRSMDDDTYRAPSQSEIIMRKLKFKTRKYLTSGGKEYVSDGIAGRHSPFAKQFIDALQKGMGGDGILTVSELMTYVEVLKTAPQFGKFGSDQLGSDFVFVVRGN
jgi:Caspase domain